MNHIILVDSPFHQLLAKFIVETIHEEESVFIFQCRSLNNVCYGNRVSDNQIFTNSLTNYNLFNFNKSVELNHLIGTVEAERLVTLYTFYESHYFFNHLRGKLNVPWSNVILFDDGIGSCIIHAMPARYRYFLQCIAAKIIKNINLPFNTLSLGMCKRLQNVASIWPDLVKVHSASVRIIDLSPYMEGVFSLKEKEGSESIEGDIVLAIGPVIAKRRMTTEQLSVYIRNVLLKSSQNGSKTILIKPHPREDKNTLISVLQKIEIDSEFEFKLIDDPSAFEEYFSLISAHTWVGMPSTVLLNRIQFSKNNGRNDKIMVFPEPNDKYPQRVKLLNDLC